MMKPESCVCGIFTILSWITVIYCKRGFMLTAPKVLDAGSIEHFTLTTFDIPENKPISIRLLKADSDDVIAETTAIGQNGHSTWVEMVIPSVLDTTARLHIQGIFNTADSYQINSVKEIHIRHQSVITFIQTDKPVYKPGQTVKIRVLPLDTYLKPLSSSTIGNIWIEDPSSIRIAQWMNVIFSRGLLQLELPLSNEPVLGRWTIHSLIHNTSDSKIFQVEEYVLPKFEVTIIPPSYILADADTIGAKICAKYTYGKMVEGILKARITYQKYQWEKKHKDLPVVEHEGAILGCHDLIIKANELLLDVRDFSYRIIEIYAEVIEDGTDTKQNATASAEITHNPLNLKFLEAERGPQYFKPGLPYHGTLEVATPDRKPVLNERIEVCVMLRKQSLTWQRQLCKNFTSNKEGLVYFTIPAQDPSIIRMAVEAKAVGHKEQLYDSWGVKIYQPHASIYLQAWFSPSGSHMQIQQITKKLRCEKLEHVKVKYTTEVGETVKFYHQVMSRGRIVQQGSHFRSFNLADDKSHDTDDTFILGERAAEKLRKRETEIDDNFNVTMPSHVGEFTLTFNSRPTMSPIARVLVFYIRPDGEIVADAREFQISHCLPNKVKLDFRHEQQYPGTDAAMLLSASPFSLCGLGVVDKSVHLLHPDNQLSKAKLFQLLEGYDLHRVTFPRQVSEDYCEKKNPRRSNNPAVHPKLDLTSNPDAQREDIIPINVDLRKKRSSIPMWYEHSSYHVDSLMAFEEAGMMILSDFTLETRPCQELEILPRTMYLFIEPRTSLSEGRPGVDGDPEAIPLMVPGRDSSGRTPNNNVEEIEVEKPHKPKSVVEIRNYFPETWLWELHSVGAAGEIALNRELPHTITEWVGSAVCIHQHMGLGISDPSHITTFQPFFVSFTLPYSVIRGEVVPIVVTVFNYLTECLPIKLALEPSTDFKVLNGISTQKFCICGGKSAVQKFMIRPYTLGHINITVYGYSLEDDAICSPEVAARLTARDAATRELLIEAEGYPKEDVYNIFFCPKDYEDEIYNEDFNLFLPDDVVEDSARAYFSVTGDLMGPTLHGLENLVQLPLGCGEQNMVLFAPNIFVLDYLFSVKRLADDIKFKAIRYMETGYQRELKFRHSDGSYSAFGIKDSNGSIWLTAFVVKSFAQARRFLSIDDNDLELSIKWIISKQFENGCFPSIGTVLHSAMKGGLSEDESSLAPLTAYILMALLETGNFTDPLVIKSALSCIEAETNASTYALALFAYVTSLCQHPSSEIYIQQLLQKSIKKDNLMYWDVSAHEESLSVSVEIAGYTILALLELGGAEKLAQCIPIVRWIAQQRNSHGGFVSTQDTVVGLQALSKYASLSFQSKLDIAVIIESDDLEKSFLLKDNNQLLVQTSNIPVIPTVLDVHATGKGCGLLQTVLRYNVYNIPGSDAFDLKVSSARVGSFDCNKPSIKVCMRYKFSGQKSNMIIVELKMVSGYFPDESSLHEISMDEGLNLKKHEINGNQVNFYFSKLSNEQKCFKFFVKHEIEVENAASATARLYDYYKPELSIATTYSIQSTCDISPLPDLDYIDENSNALSLLNSLDKPSNISRIGDPTVFSETQHRSNQPHSLESTHVLHRQENIFNQQQQQTMNIPDDGAEFDHIISPVPPPGFLRKQTDDFTNVEHDLDFPDGIEGNQPILVRPPQEFLKNQSVLPNIETCPNCYPSFPLSFNDMYCNSSFVIKAEIQDYTTGSVKILHDLSPHKQPVAIYTFGEILLKDHCNCSILFKRGNNILLLGSSPLLWNTTGPKQQIFLTKDVHIIAISSKSIQSPILKQAKSSCKKNVY